MIVRLQRPGGDSPVWLLESDGGHEDFIRPHPMLSRAMRGDVGFFEASRTPGGWTIHEDRPAAGFAAS